MLETIKAHPYITAGVGVGAIVLFYLLSSGGWGATTTVASPSSTDATAAGTAYQTAVLGASVQNNQIAAQDKAYQENQATQVTLAGIAAQSAYDIANINAGVTLANINANQAVTTQKNTLEAQVAESQFNAQTQQINAQVQENQQTLSVLSQQIQANAQTSQAAISAQAKVASGHPILDFLGTVVKAIF